MRQPYFFLFKKTKLLHVSLEKKRKRKKNKYVVRSESFTETAKKLKGPSFDKTKLLVANTLSLIRHHFVWFASNGS